MHSSISHTDLSAKKLVVTAKWGRRGGGGVGGWETGHNKEWLHFTLPLPLSYSIWRRPPLTCAYIATRWFTPRMRRPRCSPMSPLTPRSPERRKWSAPNAETRKPSFSRWEVYSREVGNGMGWWGKRKWEWDGVGDQKIGLFTDVWVKCTMT